ncbi:hypothetical protein D3C78_1928410 [compost metagenome]
MMSACSRSWRARELCAFQQRKALDGVGSDRKAFSGQDLSFIKLKSRLDII